ncbi:MAG: hypothetical protein ACXWWE_06755 [Nitrospira sp.]
MGHHERMRVRHSHWGIVSVPALAVMLSIGVMPGTVPDATSVQEQRIEIGIRTSVYVRTNTMPILAGVPTFLVIRNEDPVQHGFGLPTFAALSVRVDGEGVEIFGRKGH